MINKGKNPENYSYKKFLKKLRKNIEENELEQYKDYNIDLFTTPKHWGKLPDEEISVFQSYKGPCGDTMQFFLRIDDGIIKRAKFVTNGCGASVAAANKASELIEERTVDAGLELSPMEIDRSLGGLPIDHRHCAELATRALNRALKKYKIEQENQNSYNI